MSNKKLTGTLIPKDNKKAKMSATFYSDKPIGSGGDSEIFDEYIDATDQQRNIALANVSNQTANSTTGKMGYKVLDPTKTFAEQVTAENTIYEIRDVFDLGGTQETPVNITLPAGSTLKFNGGVIKNGVIQGNYSNINSDAIRIFDNVSMTGTWNNVECYPEWWGAKHDGINDDRVAIQSAIDSPFPKVKFGNYTYLISSTITVDGKTAGLAIGKSKIIEGNYFSRNNVTDSEIKVANGVSVDNLIFISKVYGGNTLTGGIEISNIKLTGGTDYLVERIISVSDTYERIRNIYLHDLGISYASEYGVFLIGYLMKLSNVRVSLCNGDGIRVGGGGEGGTNGPSYYLEKCYVLSVLGKCYNFEQISGVAVTNCYAELSGIDTSETFDETKIEPAYYVHNSKGIHFDSCSVETCLKPLFIDNSNDISFTSAHFHSYREVDGVDQSIINKFVVKSSKAVVFVSTAFVSSTEDNFIKTDNNNNSIHFIGCVQYTPVNQNYNPFKPESIQNYETGKYFVDYNNTIVAIDKDIPSYKSVFITTIGKLDGSDDGSKISDLSNSYCLLPKTINCGYQTQINQNTSLTISNVKGELILKFPGTSSRVNFYSTLNIVNCNKIVFEDMYMEQAVSVCCFTIQNSVVEFRNCRLLTQSGRAAFFDFVSNSTNKVILKGTYIGGSTSPTNYLVNVISPTSRIIFKDKERYDSDIVTLDGRTLEYVVDTLPASALVGTTLYYNGKMVLYNGTSWVNLDGTALS